jgi:hypothetical protein
MVCWWVSCKPKLIANKTCVEPFVKTGCRTKKYILIIDMQTGMPFIKLPNSCLIHRLTGSCEERVTFQKHLQTRALIFRISYFSITPTILYISTICNLWAVSSNRGVFKLWRCEHACKGLKLVQMPYNEIPVLTQWVAIQTVVIIAQVFLERSQVLEFRTFADNAGMPTLQ